MKDIQQKLQTAQHIISILNSELRKRRSSEFYKIKQGDTTRVYLMRNSSQRKLYFHIDEFIKNNKHLITNKKENFIDMRTSMKYTDKQLLEMIKKEIKIMKMEEADANDEKIFARKRKDGDYDILYVDSGEDVTRIDANVYPVGSSKSTRYEHPEGIILSKSDVNKLKIDIE